MIRYTVKSIRPSYRVSKGVFVVLPKIVSVAVRESPSPPWIDSVVIQEIVSVDLSTDPAVFDYLNSAILNGAVLG